VTASASVYVHPEYEPVSVTASASGETYYSLYEFDNGYGVEVTQEPERFLVIPCKYILIDGKRVRIASAGEFEYLDPATTTDAMLTEYISNVAEQMQEAQLEDLINEARSTDSEL